VPNGFNRTFHPRSHPDSRPTAFTMMRYINRRSLPFFTFHELTFLQCGLYWRTRLLDETKWSETPSRDAETFGLRRDIEHFVTRPRFKMLLRLKTVLRTRRWDWDHIPVYIC